MDSLVILTVDERSVLQSILEAIDTRLDDYVECGALEGRDAEIVAYLLEHPSHAELDEAEVGVTQKVLAGDAWDEVFGWEDGDPASLAIGSLCSKVFIP